MTHDPTRLQPVLAGAAPLDLHVTFRPIVGDLFAYTDGRPFASPSDVGPALKVAGGEHDANMALPAAAALRDQSDQPASQSYVVVPEAVLSQPAGLRSWGGRSVSSSPAERVRKQQA